MAKLKIFTGLIALMGVMLALTACGDRNRDRDSDDRIRRAINDIEVRLDGRTPRTLGELRHSDERGFTYVEIIIDFARLTRDLQYYDFFNARDNLDEHIDDLYSDIAMMYTRTNRLTVVERNFSALDNFRLPPDLLDTEDFTVNISRFLENHGQFLAIDTQFGRLEVYSDFFFGRVGLNEQQHNSSLRFSFQYEGYDAPSIILQILRQDEIDRYSRNPSPETRPRPINIEYPGQSSRLSIPLDADFMRGANGELLYNAVEFFCHDGVSGGILPRSFIDGTYLHVFFNRTGEFRLTRTPHGNTTNRVDFLRDRGIVLQGIYHNGQTVVTRGEMYSALMSIHRAENLFFDTSNIVRFRDTWGELELQINVGQALGVLSGFPDGYFRPDIPLLRRDTFVMLANQIAVFGFEVDGLKPPRSGIIGMPSGRDEAYWYRHISELVAMGFVPFRTVLLPATNYEPERYIFDLAPIEPLTVEEAHEILFRLITLDVLEPIGQ